MKKIAFLAGFALTVISSQFAYAENLSEKVSAQFASDQVKHGKREASFAEMEADLNTQWLALKAELKQLTQESEALTKAFHQNKTQLQALEKENIEHSQAIQQVSQSMIGLSHTLNENQNGHLVYSHTFSNLLKALTQTHPLIKGETIADFIHHFQQALSQTSRINRVEMPILQENGQIQTAPVYQLGTVALLGQGGYLHWDANYAYAKYYPQQEMRTEESFRQFVAELAEPQTTLIEIDPYMGKTFLAQKQAIHWMMRVEQSGLVGGIIISLFVLGIGITSARTFSLLKTARDIAQQIKQPEINVSNPLGRIYAVYEDAKALPNDVIEIKLDEAITTEQQGLEKGLSLLKLLAAVSPMLGLLGTVTGMIQTFQVMSQDDAQSMGLMAEGISMALTTTALGLMAAMPLLFAHNRLQSLVDGIQNTLECVSLGMIAKQIEKSSTASVISASVTRQTDSVSYV